MSTTDARIDVLGRCLCGGVAVEEKSVDPHMGACHCETCRTWGGGPLLSVNCGSDVAWQGEALIQRFASSAWACRGFCKVCGTHLFYQLNESGEFFVPAGLLNSCEAVSELAFKRQIYTDHKPNYYQFSDETDTMTEAEVLAAYTDEP